MNLANPNCMVCGGTNDPDGDGDRTCICAVQLSPEDYEVITDLAMVQGYTASLSIRLRRHFGSAFEDRAIKINEVLDALRRDIQQTITTRHEVEWEAKRRGSRVL